MTTNSTPMKTAKNCASCGSNKPATILFSVRGYEIAKCTQCGLVFILDQPTQAQLEHFYSIEYFEGDIERKGYQSYAADRTVLEKNFRQHMKIINSKIGVAKGRLLEVGCAYGFFLEVAKPYFQEVIGVEFSSDAADYARNLLGLDVRTGDLLDQRFDSGSFDVVTMWDVIEHMSDPKAVLNEVNRLLKPGGHLFITTGDIDSFYARLFGKSWRLINPPQHLFYFSTRTLSQLLTQRGYTVESVAHPGKYVSLAFITFILSYLSGRKIHLGKTFSDLSLYVNLYDAMLVHVRKPDHSKMKEDQRD